MLDVTGSVLGYSDFMQTGGAFLIVWLFSTLLLKKNRNIFLYIESYQLFRGAVWDYASVALAASHSTVIILWDHYSVAF